MAEQNDTLIIEHIHRSKVSSNLKWRYPMKNDILPVEQEQILDCNIQGEWNILSSRQSEFTLANHITIEAKFQEVKHLI